jgi:transcriptional regulator with XRE-family HTH domain
MKISTDISASVIGQAIRQMRVRSGLTQEDFSRRLGCRLRALQRWEAGESIPSGDWLLKVLVLGRPTGALALFGITEPDRGPLEQGLEMSVGGELARYFNNALEGLKLLYEAAAAGSPGARESLRHEADRLVERAAQWRDAQASRRDLVGRRAAKAKKIKEA